MDQNITEEQQIELIKKVWKEYGWSVIIGATLALLIGFGWRFYQRVVTTRAEHAAVLYEHVMSDLGQSQNEAASQKAILLVSDFKRTPYAVLASFVLANIAVEQNRLDEANQHLQWAVKHASRHDFLPIARIRLARLYIAQNKPDQALPLLSAEKTEAFQGVIAEIKGDAYVALKQYDAAKEAYRQALDLLAPDALNRPFIKMKFSDLPEARNTQ